MKPDSSEDWESVYEFTQGVLDYMERESVDDFAFLMYSKEEYKAKWDTFDSDKQQHLLGLAHNGIEAFIDKHENGPKPVAMREAVERAVNQIEPSSENLLRARELLNEMELEGID